MKQKGFKFSPNKNRKRKVIHAKSKMSKLNGSKNYFKKYKSQQAADVKRMQEEREARKNMNAEIRNMADSLSKSFLVFDTVNLSSTADVNPLTEEFSRNSPTLNN